MYILILITVLIVAYLLGSIPAAVWIGKFFYGKDVRNQGSGNAGTINSIRAFGWKAGLCVLIIDVSKGILATLLPLFLNINGPFTGSVVETQILAGIMAIVGHIFPLFANFKGGKGVATIYGILLALYPVAALICVGAFVIILLLTGISSVASISSVTVFPILLWSVFDTTPLILKIFSICLVVILVITHHSNIKRLFNGNENRLFSIFGKK